MRLCPDSSGGQSTGVSNPEAGRSSRPRGSTYQYIIVRKEFSGGALLAQVAHAAGESVIEPLPDDVRVVVLVATKEQMASVRDALSAAGVPHKPILETDGPLEGVLTAIGLVTTNRDELRPILGELRPYR